jgi:plastocyanin domain-containing protein
MTPVGKIVKILLALTVVGVLVAGLQGCKRDTPPPAPAQPPTLSEKAAGAAPVERVVEMKVTDNGFEPSPVTLKKGEPVTVKVTRVTDNTCATDFVLDEHNINQKLPLNQTVAIHFTPEKTGELKYGCAMQKMVSGRFVIE